ncbi:hypothetical protein Syun_006030 [Stephania yunnanensis]|uniref:Uncharacterized protein n=1 Tax=Stephania yunnanensis TaxID=152371 RepID=A0AAP0KZ89_9MAGN
MSMIIRPPPPPPPFIIDTPKEQPQHDDDDDDEESLEELMKRVEMVKEMMKGGEYVDKFLMRNVVGEEEEVVVMRGHVEVMVGHVVERFWEKPVEYLRSGGGRLEDRVKDLRRIVGIFEQACLDHGKEAGSSKRGKQCPFLQSFNWLRCYEDEVEVVSCQKSTSTCLVFAGKPLEKPLSPRRLLFEYSRRLSSLRPLVERHRSNSTAISPLKTIIDSFKTTKVPPKNHFPSFPIPSNLNDLETSNSPSKQFGSTSIVDSLKTTIAQSENCFRITLNDLDFSNCSTNPFNSSASAQVRFRSVQAECRALLDRLELRREKARTRLRGNAKLVSSLNLQEGFLESTRSRVDSDGCGGSRDVHIEPGLGHNKPTRARLDDELEHIRDTVRFWVEHKEGRFKPDSELARQIQKNELSFREQLDELEEHLYLCFMTINRARSLVMKEILEGVQV